MRFLISLAFAALPLFSQSKGSINGDVTDSSGAVIPNAKVKVRAGAIALERNAVTNENGAFIVVGLQAADYSITVEAAGFKSLVRSGLHLDTDMAATVKLQLEVGQLTERIEVSAEASQVEVSNGEVSREITQKQLQDYALPGRNPYYMLGIVPGVVSRYGNFTTDFRGGSYSMGGLQVNGQKKDTNFQTLDGISNTRNRDGVQVNNILGVDFIEEVKVQATH